MFVVHFASGSRAPISCDCASYRDALAWVRENWTKEDGELWCAVTIVKHK